MHPTPPPPPQKTKHTHRTRKERKLLQPTGCFFPQKSRDDTSMTGCAWGWSGRCSVEPTPGCFQARWQWGVTSSTHTWAYPLQEVSSRGRTVQLHSSFDNFGNRRLSCHQDCKVLELKISLTWDSYS